MNLHEIYLVISECNPTGVVGALDDLQNSSLVATSRLAADLSANSMRLSNQISSWTAAYIDLDPKLRIDLGDLKVIGKISTKGGVQGDGFVQSYTVEFAFNWEFEYLLDARGETRLFAANTDQTTVVSHCVDDVMARMVRLGIQKWFSTVSIRIDIYVKENGWCKRIDLKNCSDLITCNSGFRYMYLFFFWQLCNRHPATQLKNCWKVCRIPPFPPPRLHNPPIRTDRTCLASPRSRRRPRREDGNRTRPMTSSGSKWTSEKRN